MDHLPQETIIEILSRLPVKTVGNCRCVSKPWNYLLTHPQFIKTHLKNNQNKESLLFKSPESAHRSLYSAQLNNAHHLFDEITLVATKLTFVDHLFASAEIRSTACCDGLILLLDQDRGFTLINPTTKQVNVLPTFGDRSGLIPWFGIGYDSMNDDYIVVVIFSCNISKRFEPKFIDKSFNVYSVRNGMWKGAKSFLYRVDCLNNTGVYADGYLYWLANSALDGSSVILEFDIHQEKFREVQRLSSLFDVEDVADVVVTGGCFGVALFSNRGVVDFWKMEKRGVEESWTKFSVINPEKLPMKPLCFMAKEKLVLLKYVVCTWGIDPQLVMIDLKDDHTFKNIVVHGIPDHFSVQGTFIESLISPHCDANVARAPLL